MEAISQPQQKHGRNLDDGIAINQMPDEQDPFDRWVEESTTDPYYYKPVYQLYRKLLRLIGQHPTDVIPGSSFLEEIEEGDVIAQLQAIRQLVEWSFLVPQRAQELPEYETYVTISDFRINYRISRQVKRFLDLELNNISDLQEAILILLRATALSEMKEWFLNELVMMLNSSVEKVVPALRMLDSKKLVATRIYIVETDGSVWQQQSWARITREGILYLEKTESGGSFMTVINIDHSQIGLLNTGSIRDVEHIDVNLSTLVQSGHQEVAAALKELTEAVASSKDVSQEDRKLLLDQLDTISSQAALPSQERKTGIIKPILGGLAAGLSAVGSLAKIWSVTGDPICRFFGVENPIRN